MDEAAVCQRASSFRCVTDAPNDVINHDAAPFKGDLRGQGSGEGKPIGPSETGTCKVNTVHCINA